MPEKILTATEHSRLALDNLLCGYYGIAALHYASAAELLTPELSDENRPEIVHLRTMAAVAFMNGLSPDKWTKAGNQLMIVLDMVKTPEETAEALLAIASHYERRGEMVAANKALRAVASQQSSEPDGEFLQEKARYRLRNTS